MLEITYLISRRIVMSKVTPKNQAKVIQTRMKELGYENFKLGQAQELLASLHGEQSWNVLSSKLKVKKPDFLQETTSNLENEGKHSYIVRADCDIQCKLLVEISADSIEEAHDKVITAFDEDGDFNSVWTNPENWKPNYVEGLMPRLTEITSDSGGSTIYNDDGLERTQLDDPSVYHQPYSQELMDDLLSDEFYVDTIKRLSAMYLSEESDMEDAELVSAILLGSNDIYDVVCLSGVDENDEDDFIQKNYETFVKSVATILELGAFKK